MLNDLREVTLKVFSAGGQLVYSEDNINADKHQFEIKETPGVYFVQLITKIGKQQFKLVIVESQP